MIIGIILVAGIVNPWVFIPTVPLAILFIFIRRYYLSTSRDIKRLEATSKMNLFMILISDHNNILTVLYCYVIVMRCELNQPVVFQCNI